MTIKFKNGETREVSSTTGGSLNKTIEEGDAERVIYNDSLSGTFVVKLSDVESCK